VAATPTACTALQLARCVYLPCNLALLNTTVITLCLCLAIRVSVHTLHYTDRLIASGGFAFDIVLSNPYVPQPISKLHGHTAPIVGVQIVPGKLHELEF
jgi:hypothetical protein